MAARQSLRESNERARQQLEGKTAQQPSAPTPIKQPVKTPGVPGHLQLPPDSTRNVTRYIAICPITAQEADTVEGLLVPCAFNQRDKKLRRKHTTKDGAEVEAGKHIREVHADVLWHAVTVVRKRAIVSEEEVEE